MKKYPSFLLIVAVALALTGCDPCKENLFTKLGDKLATIGKSGVERDQVLAQRAADRAGKCANAKAGEMKKKMGF